jgi:hypothetical protein
MSKKKIIIGGIGLEVALIMTFVLGIIIFYHFNEDFHYPYVYLNKNGDDLGSSVHISDVKAVIILDYRDAEFIYVHFEIYVDPDNWSDASHIPDNMKAIYRVDGTWISGCNKYNVTKEAIDHLLSWSLI